MLNALLRNPPRPWGTLLFAFLLGMLIHGPDIQAQIQSQGSSYKSEIDDLLSIQSVSTLPFTDNLQGIYARPLEIFFTEKLQGLHRWDFLPLNIAGPLLSPDELASDLSRAQALAAQITADAFFSGRISKGPNGVAINLGLFLKKDGKLIAQALLKDSKRFDLDDLKSQLDQLLAKVIQQIPYQGRVLSRDGQRITINLGKKDGLQGGQVVSIIQIVTATRHPKFNFLINTEKEIIGRAKVLKVDDTLSFAVVLSEKGKGTIQKGAKISGLDFVSYPDTGSLAPETQQDLAEDPSKKISFGENPSAWVPKKPPTFGQVGARFGLGMYNGSTKLPSVGTLDGENKFAPSVFIEGELWVTSELSVHAGFKQAILAISNPRSGASPSELNQSLTQYELLLGYNFRMGQNIWGPNLELLAGYMTHKLFVDDSTPEAFTTTEYVGFKAGAKGSFPVTQDGRWSAGAQAFIVLLPRLNESPVTSGASNKSDINMFGVLGGYKLGENMRVQAHLDFELYSTTFSGAGTRTESATSASQRHTTLSGGLYYLF